MDRLSEADLQQVVAEIDKRQQASRQGSSQKQQELASTGSNEKKEEEGEPRDEDKDKDKEKEKDNTETAERGQEIEANKKKAEKLARKKRLHARNMRFYRSLASH